MSLLDLCRCDRALSERGLCPHCDGPGPCPPKCPDCAMRDLVCPICKTTCPTRAAATRHEAICRNKERRNQK